MASEITVFSFHLSPSLKKTIKSSKAFHLLLAKLDKEKDCICMFLTPNKKTTAQVIKLSFLQKLIKHFGSEKKALKALFKCFQKQFYAVKKMPKGAIDTDLVAKVDKVLKAHKEFELTEQGEVVAVFED